MTKLVAVSTDDEVVHVIKATTEDDRDFEADWAVARATARREIQEWQVEDLYDIMAGWGWIITEKPWLAVSY